MSRSTQSTTSLPIRPSFSTLVSHHISSEPSDFIWYTPIAPQPIQVFGSTSNHISPEPTDFITYTPIAPQPIQDIEGTSVLAFGIGTIQLSATLFLHNARFAPAATTRVINVIALNRDNSCSTLFTSDCCQIQSNQTGAPVARGLCIRPNVYIITTVTP
jgi:hypothetical protein